MYKDFVAVFEPIYDGIITIQPMIFRDNDKIVCPRVQGFGEWDENSFQFGYHEDFRGNDYVKKEWFKITALGYTPDTCLVVGGKANEILANNHLAPPICVYPFIKMETNGNVLYLGQFSEIRETHLRFAKIGKFIAEQTNDRRLSIICTVILGLDDI